MSLITFTPMAKKRERVDHNDSLRFAGRSFAATEGWGDYKFVMRCGRASVSEEQIIW